VSCHELLPSSSFELLLQKTLEQLPTLLMSLSRHASQTLPAPRRDLACQIGYSKQQLALREGKNLRLPLSWSALVIVVVVDAFGMTLLQICGEVRAFPGDSIDVSVAMIILGL
jgi:hypothetical protein